MNLIKHHACPAKHREEMYTRAIGEFETQVGRDANSDEILAMLIAFRAGVEAKADEDQVRLTVLEFKNIKAMRLNFNSPN